jgi:beta-lactamase regulating signal transducer with metallopeptidase domain
MDTLVHLGLLNAVLATLLALLAAAARWLRFRPALVHALWLLVLLKLLTPPFVAVPVTWWPRSDPESAPLPAEEQRLSEPPDEDSFTTPPEAQAVTDLPHSAEDGARPNPNTMPDASAAAGTSDMGAEPVRSPAGGEASTPVIVSEGSTWEQIIGALWLTGSVLWWTVAGARLVRFRMSLRSAWQVPPALQERAERLAAQLGLARCPRVYLLPAPIMPLLWAVAGRPCLLLPAVLWARLSPVQQETLLAHELAHLRRGDPWVRRLELVVLGLYWWHPLVWWARHELQEAEDQCCDAWVLWALPAATETYATTLLETVAYLSPLRPALPVGASGVGRTYSLRRRLTMIFQGTTPRALSWSAVAILLVCGTALLPLGPTWGQDRQSGPSDDTAPVASRPAAGTSVAAQQATPASSTKISGTVVSSDAGLASSPSAPHDIEEAKDAVELIQVQLEGKKAELREARALVDQSRRQIDRLSKLRAQGGVSEEEVDQVRTELAVREARLHAKEAQIKEAEVRLRQANRWLSRLQGGARHSGSTGISSAVGGQHTSSSISGTNISVEASAADRGVGTPSGSAATSHAPAGSRGTLPKGLEHSTTPAGGEQRMRELEQKLDKLLKDVEALRRELRRLKPDGAARATEKPAAEGSSAVPKR